MTKVHLGMWGKMMPKRGGPEFPTRITLDVLYMLSSEDSHALNMVPYPYVGMDWRGFPEIFFIADEPSDDRGNINAMFKLL